MPLNFYIGSGSYVNSCDNGVQPNVTGHGVFTGFLDQCDSDGRAYALAIQNAAYLRSLSPCLSDATTTTTTTTTTSTTTIPPNFTASGDFSYNWTGDFIGEENEYYDIIAWGKTNGYLSGNKYNTNQYFSSLSANDINGLGGVVIGVIKGSGLLSGFGNNSVQLLNIPNNLTGIIQVSIGHDHVLALRSNGYVTGWGRDNWGALNILSQISGVRKVCAGIGASVFLLESGYITGTSTIGGGYAITYPTNSGFLDIDHYGQHILALTSGGLLTGIGRNNFNESSLTHISGVKKISAGISTSMVLYNNGYVTGYGTDQAKFNTPSINQSGVSIQLRAHIGTILKTNQDIEQWVTPWNDEYSNAIPPDYLQNNVVAISQGANFTAAIFKRLYSGTNFSIYPKTGHHFLWKVIDVGESDSYGGISVNDTYPPLSTVIQPCDNYSFILPDLSGFNEFFTGNNVTNCSPYGGGTHSIIFSGVRSRPPILNINYTKTGYAPKTGWAVTGIATGDYWNPYLYHELYNKRLYYSDNSLSSISGGYIAVGTGSGINFPHNDNMYATLISGSGGKPIVTFFDRFDTGNYKMHVYAHASGSGNHSRVSVFKNGISVVSNSGTTIGPEFSNSTFNEGNQYIASSFTINNNNDIIMVRISGSYLNGIQIIKLE